MLDQDQLLMLGQGMCGLFWTRISSLLGLEAGIGVEGPSVRAWQGSGSGVGPEAGAGDPPGLSAGDARQACAGTR